MQGDNQPDYAKIGEVMKAYQALSQHEKQVVRNQMPVSSMVQPLHVVDLNERARFFVIMGFLAILAITIFGLILTTVLTNQFSQPILTVATTILGYLAGVITPSGQKDKPVSS